MKKLQPSSKDRDKRLKQSVGLLMLLTIGLVALTIWFGNIAIDPLEEKLRLHVIMDHAFGISEGTPVTLAGIPTGQVKQIFFNTDNKIQLILEVSLKHGQNIRGDSQITLNSPILGKPTLDISLGSNAYPLLVEGASIPLNKQPDIAAIMAQLPPKLQKIDKILSNTDILIQQLIDPEAAFQTSLQQISKSMESINDFTSQMTKQDGHLRKSLENLAQLSADFSILVKNLHNTQNLANDLLANVSTGSKQTTDLFKDI